MTGPADSDTWEPPPSYDNNLSDECWHHWCDQCPDPTCEHHCHNPDGPPLYQPATPVTVIAVRDQLL